MPNITLYHIINSMNPRKQEEADRKARRQVEAKALEARNPPEPFVALGSNNPTIKAANNSGFSYDEFNIPPLEGGACVNGDASQKHIRRK